MTPAFTVHEIDVLLGAIETALDDEQARTLRVKLEHLREIAVRAPTIRRTVDRAFAEASHHVPGQYRDLRLALTASATPRAADEFLRLVHALTGEVDAARRRARRWGLP